MKELKKTNPINLVEWFLGNFLQVKANIISQGKRRKTHTPWEFLIADMQIWICLQEK